MNNSSTPGALRSNRQREKNRVTNKSQLDIYNKVLSKIHLDVLVEKKRGGGGKTGKEGSWENSGNLHIIPENN